MHARSSFHVSQAEEGLGAGCDDVVDLTSDARDPPNPRPSGPAPLVCAPPATTPAMTSDSRDVKGTCPGHFELAPAMTSDSTAAGPCARTAVGPGPGEMERRGWPVKPEPGRIRVELGHGGGVGARLGSESERVRLEEEGKGCLCEVGCSIKVRRRKLADGCTTSCAVYLALAKNSISDPCPIGSCRFPRPRGLSGA